MEGKDKLMGRFGGMGELLFFFWVRMATFEPGFEKLGG